MSRMENDASSNHEWHRDSITKNITLPVMQSLHHHTKCFELKHSNSYSITFVLCGATVCHLHLCVFMLLIHIIRSQFVHIALGWHIWDNLSTTAGLAQNLVSATLSTGINCWASICWSLDMDPWPRGWGSQEVWSVRSRTGRRSVLIPYALATVSVIEPSHKSHNASD